MNYIEKNKIAWEEAFDRRYENWGDDIPNILATQKLPFFNSDVIKELKNINFIDKTVAHFCCNNGRELLSLMQLNPKNGVGFDIAENIIKQAKENAIKTKQHNCEFVAYNILEIDEKYHNSFDFIMLTIGAITWFQDLNLLFDKISKCLKSNGVLLINEFHPFIDMLPLPHDEEFDPNNLNKICYSYFKTDPWIENNGMSYMTPEYKSKTFTSFSQNLSDIINALIGSGLQIKKFNEYQYDIGITKMYDGKGYPLSFILIAQKV